MFDNKNHFKQCTESCLNPCIFESVSKCKFRVKLVEFVKVLHFSGGGCSRLHGLPLNSNREKSKWTPSYLTGRSFKETSAWRLPQETISSKHTVHDINTTISSELLV